jgi:hypothetical protein
MAKRQMSQRQTMVHKTLQRKLKLEQQEPHLNQRLNADTLEDQEDPFPLQYEFAVGKVLYLPFFQIYKYCLV